MSLDELEVAFTKKPNASLDDPKTLIYYVGTYELARTIYQAEALRFGGKIKITGTAAKDLD